MVIRPAAPEDHAAVHVVVAAAFWTEIDQLAKDHGVKVALELHPQNLVFNARDVRKLVELTGVTHVGVELDAGRFIALMTRLLRSYDAPGAAGPLGTGR